MTPPSLERIHVALLRSLHQNPCIDPLRAFWADTALRLLCCFQNFRDTRTLLSFQLGVEVSGHLSKITDENLVCVFVGNTFLHWSLTVKSQQNIIELMTRPGGDRRRSRPWSAPNYDLSGQSHSRLHSRQRAFRQQPGKIQPSLRHSCTELRDFVPQSYKILSTLKNI